MHRMSGSDVILKFKSREMPLIGDLCRSAEKPMKRQILARGKNYSVSHEYETVWLTRPDGTTTIIGDFYGDPQAAVVDWKERWCVVVGAGLILYRLREPFLPYEYDRESEQWWEVHRHEPDIWWIEAVYQVSENDLRFVVDPYDNGAGVYELDTERLAIRRLIPPEQDAEPPREPDAQ